MLHKSGAEFSEGTLTSLSNFDDLDASKDLVRKVVEEWTEKIKEEPSVSERSIRWELGSSWMQHLQKQETSTDVGSDNKNGNVEQAVKGLGNQFKFLKKREKKASELDGTDSREPNNDELSSSNELETLLSKEAFSRIKESGSGLHLKVCGILSLGVFCCHHLFYLKINLYFCHFSCDYGNFIYSTW